MKIPGGGSKEFFIHSHLRLFRSSSLLFFVSHYRCSLPAFISWSSFSIYVMPSRIHYDPRGSTSHNKQVLPRPLPLPPFAIQNLDMIRLTLNSIYSSSLAFVFPILLLNNHGLHKNSALLTTLHLNFLLDETAPPSSSHIHSLLLLLSSRPPSVVLGQTGSRIPTNLLEGPRFLSSPRARHFKITGRPLSRCRSGSRFEFSERRKRHHPCGAWYPSADPCHGGGDWGS